LDEGFSIVSFCENFTFPTFCCLYWKKRTLNSNSRDFDSYRNDEILTLNHVVIFVVDAIDKHSSVITHLLSQVRLGMDLTKVT